MIRAVFEDEMTEDMLCVSDADYARIQRREKHEAAIDEARATERAIRGVASLVRRELIMEGKE